jgi:general secretion pathway protein A
MYERFYGLRERPFSLTPDPAYLYLGRVHQEAFGYLRYGVESQAGFVVITGEIGSGKTTLIQSVLRGLDRDTTVGHLVNTLLGPSELIESVMIEFGLDPAGQSKPIRLRELARFLVDQRRAGRLVLLVIDEAQNLDLAALEEIRMLSNLETEKSKLIQIVLLGQPELRDKLARPELAQLRQRITVSYHLRPLDAPETAAYVNHRLRRASIGPPLEFPRDATDRVYEGSGGVPRLINVICDATLVFGYADDRRSIDVGLVDEVLSELEQTRIIPARTSDAVREPAMAAPTATEQEQATSAPLEAVETLHALEQREEQLHEREQRMARREREMQEQARALAEEYRVLRSRWAPAESPTAPQPAQWPPTTPRAQQPAAARAPQLADHRPRPDPKLAQRPAAPGPRLIMRAESRPHGFWQRMKRLIIGSSEPLAEDRY